MWADLLAKARADLDWSPPATVDDPGRMVRYHRVSGLGRCPCGRDARVTDVTGTRELCYPCVTSLLDAPAVVDGDIPDMQCRSVSTWLSCTRRDGHPGQHVAHGLEIDGVRAVLQTWLP